MCVQLSALIQHNNAYQTVIVIVHIYPYVIRMHAWYT
jgi:hypothetical protein